MDCCLVAAAVDVAANVVSATVVNTANRHFNSHVDNDETYVNTRENFQLFLHIRIYDRNRYEKFIADFKACHMLFIELVRVLYIFLIFLCIYFVSCCLYGEKRKIYKYRFTNRYPILLVSTTALR